MFIVDDILDKLKNILKTDSKTKKVFDKELAEALDLTQANFATMKNRGKIPYTNILKNLKFNCVYLIGFTNQESFEFLQNSQKLQALF